MCDALKFVGDSNPQMGLIGRSLDKHMRRNPIPDDDIRQALEWAQKIIDGILTGDMPALPDDVVEAEAIPLVDVPTIPLADIVPPLVPFEPADEMATASV